jgi:hypothetical protein
MSGRVGSTAYHALPLVGLDIANRHTSKEDQLYSVYLSGNGPLVAVLIDAPARDRVRRAAERGERARIGEARSEVRSFIQAVHRFRDDGLVCDQPPAEHVARFDEARPVRVRARASDRAGIRDRRQSSGVQSPVVLTHASDQT